MKAKLIVVGGTTSTSEVNLRLPAVIGRGRSAQITIPHSLVSRQHCEISESEGRLVVRDLDSLNGTYVGDERIAEAILEPGALLTVGTVTFRAIYAIGDDSPSEALQDTSHDVAAIADTDDLLDIVRPVVEEETVPIKGSSFSDELLPPRLSDPSEPADGKATQPMPDGSIEPSLESAAKNSH